jgi:hypothetical protein
VKVDRIPHQAAPSQSEPGRAEHNASGWRYGVLGMDRVDPKGRPGPQGCNAGITPGYRPVPPEAERLATLEAECVQLREDVDRLARALASLAAAGVAE